MKKLFLSILLTSAMAAPMFAQGHTPPTPAQMVARRVAHLTTLLDLMPGQVTTATAAYTLAATNNATLEPQLRAARQALKADIEGTTGGKGIAADTTTIGTLEGQILANDATAEAALWAVLSTTQQDKLKALGPGGMGGMGMGPGGPRGFGGPH
jgi:hypothetical protein